MKGNTDKDIVWYGRSFYSFRKTSGKGCLKTNAEDNVAMKCEIIVFFIMEIRYPAEINKYQRDEVA